MTPVSTLSYAGSTLYQIAGSIYSKSYAAMIFVTEKSCATLSALKFSLLSSTMSFNAISLFLYILMVTFIIYLLVCIWKEVVKPIDYLCEIKLGIIKVKLMFKDFLENSIKIIDPCLSCPGCKKKAEEFTKSYKEMLTSVETDIKQTMSKLTD